MKSVVSEPGRFTSFWSLIAGATMTVATASMELDNFIPDNFIPIDNPDFLLFTVRVIMLAREVFHTRLQRRVEKWFQSKQRWIGPLPVGGEANRMKYFMK